MKGGKEERIVFSLQSASRSVARSWFFVESEQEERQLQGIEIACSEECACWNISKIGQLSGKLFLRGR